MQKNKIDVVKAVCNIAAKKLAVLSLAVTVSGGVVACAQMSEDEANRQFQKLQVPERMNEEAPQDRLRRLEREREEKWQQAKERKRQSDENWLEFQRKKRQRIEKDQQLKFAHLCEECIRLREEGLRLNDEAMRLFEEAESLLDEVNHLVVEVRELDVQIAVLRGQIEREQHEEPGEELVEVVSEDRDDANGEQPRENRNGTVDGAFPQDAFRNMLRFHMPNQRQDSRGGMFNMMRPFGSKK